jgi:protein-S-isoprenylcysteine O-methyltransferase Ste14
MLARLEHRVAPPIVMVVTALLMWGCSTQTRGGVLPAPFRTATFAILLLVGLALSGLGLVALRRAGTTTDPIHPHTAAAIVTSGIYRWTRNPMYLGFACVLVGWAVWLQSGWALPGPVIFAAWITRLQIVPEERALRLRFGAAYHAYCNGVRRWL